MTGSVERCAACKAERRLEQLTLVVANATGRARYCCRPSLNVAVLPIGQCFRFTARSRALDEISPAAYR